jgi:nucleotide-binding universal stress UspA family protein
MEGFNINMYGNDESSGIMVRKRVMVIVDGTSHSKHAMIWALTHVVNKGDLLTLLHIVSPQTASESYSSTYLVNHLGSLCKDCKPEVTWLICFIYFVDLDSKNSLNFQCCSK